MDLASYVSPFAGDPNGYGDDYDTVQSEGDAMYDDMFKVMITGQDNTGEWDIAALRAEFKFSVHGDDKDGNWDIEFPTMFDAVGWFRCWRSEIAEFKIRENDCVRDLQSTVVMTMTPKVKF